MIRRDKNRMDTFLSLKRIALLSLAISAAFYIMFLLVLFFSESLGFGPERDGHPKPTAERMHQMDPDTLRPKIGPNPMAEAPFKGAPRGTMSPRNKPFPKGRLFAHFLYTFCMSFVLFLYTRKMLSIKYRKGWSERVFVLFGTMLITTTMSIGFSLAMMVFSAPYPPMHFKLNIIRDGLVRDFSISAIIIMASYLLRSLYQQKIIAVENEALRTENIRSHYEALKSQMDPHFLFNSMNTLQSLVEIDKDKASGFVQQLSMVLRYTLQNKDVVALSDEMECVKAYCNMMQIRYGDNLKFDLRIDTKYAAYQILPLSVQGLIENAIKHNVISTKQPLTVSVATDDGALLKVSNPIQPKIQAETDGGIGLANLAERYRLKWEKEIGISDDGRFFEVTIPLIKPNEEK